MGLDWMNRLGIALNTTTADVKIHNTKLNETQKKILKFKKRIQGPILQLHGNKEFISKDKSERRRKNNTTEKQTSTDSFARTSSQ